MSHFLRRLLITPVRSIARRRSSTAIPKFKDAADEYPFLMKYSPLWGPVVVGVVLNTLMAQDERAREFFESIFPSYGTANIV